MLKLCFVNPGATSQLKGNADFFGGAEHRSILLAELLLHNKLADVTFVTTESIPHLSIKTISLLPRIPFNWLQRLQNRASQYLPFVYSPVLLKLSEKTWDSDAYIVFGVSTFAYDIFLQCKNRGKKFILVLTSDDCLNCDLSPKLIFQRNPFGCPRWIGYALVSQADQIWAQTEVQNEILMNKFHRRGRLITNPLSFLLTTQVPPFNQRHGILWIGKNNEIKDPRSGLEIAKQIPELPFTFVVNGFKGSELEKEFQKLDMPNVTILEKASRKEIEKLMSNHRLFFNTSQFEGMPNTFLEAWGKGTPILSLRACEYLFKLKKAPGCFAENSREIMISSIQEIYNSPEKWSVLSRQGKEYIEINHSSMTIIQSLSESIACI